MYTQVSIKDTRDNLSEIVEQVAIGDSEYVVTKFGKPKVLITKIDEEYNLEKKKAKYLKTYGAWEGREDIRDPDQYAEKLRKNSRRKKYDKVFT